MSVERCERCGGRLDERGLCWEAHGHLLPDGVATEIAWPASPSPTQRLDQPIIVDGKPVYGTAPTQREEASRDTQPRRKFYEVVVLTRNYDGDTEDLMQMGNIFQSSSMAHVAHDRAVAAIREVYQNSKGAVTIAAPGPSLPTEPQRQLCPRHKVYFDYQCPHCLMDATVTAQVKPAALPTEAPRVEDAKCLVCDGTLVKRVDGLLYHQFNGLLACTIRSFIEQSCP